MEVENKNFSLTLNETLTEIEEKNLIIENDKYKMKYANENGFSVIRILQEDVIKNKYNWLEKIQLNITKILNEKIGLRANFFSESEIKKLLKDFTIVNLTLQKNETKIPNNSNISVWNIICQKKIS
jgi:hypothetical protein